MNFFQVPNVSMQKSVLRFVLLNHALSYMQNHQTRATSSFLNRLFAQCLFPPKLIDLAYIREHQDICRYGKVQGRKLLVILLKHIKQNTRSNCKKGKPQKIFFFLVVWPLRQYPPPLVAKETFFSLKIAQIELFLVARPPS